VDQELRKKDHQIEVGDLNRHFVLEVLDSKKNLQGKAQMLKEEQCATKPTGRNEFFITENKETDELPVTQDQFTQVIENLQVECLFMMQLTDQLKKK